MVEPDTKGASASGGQNGPAKPPKPPNPIWRMMGLPNFRFRLPSRNWMIFLGITGSWAAAVIYDRREKRRIQRKWTKLVEHISQETMDERQMPRKLTVYLSAPPADGLVPARDHFNEYVKPILVAAALDWDAVEGRREGDVRAGLAERIRRLRIKRGEQSTEPLEVDLTEILEETRQRSGVKDWDGPGGDIVIGRHAWKEYIRGLHEGWLGPLNPPMPLEEPSISGTAAPEAALEVSTTIPDTSMIDASPTATPEVPRQKEADKAEVEENKPKKKKQPPPFNTTAEYQESALSPSCPRALGPAAVIPFPHLLGFFNFPIRMYRFINRRKLADDVGRQTAAAVLGVYRPYHTSADDPSIGGESDLTRAVWEQQRLLTHEEPEWHKSVRERKDDEDKERVWLDDMTIDSRIGERMRRFELDAEAEGRAERIKDKKEGSWFKSLWPKKEERKPWEGLIGDVD